jgi:hypothetical protein
MNELRILLIDDSEAAIDKIKRFLKDEQEVDILSPLFSDDLKHIKQALTDEEPTDLFMDYFFPDNQLLPDILESLGKDLIKDKRIWIISGLDISFREMLDIRTEWPDIQNAWLAKPFDKEDLLSFLNQVKSKSGQKSGLKDRLNKLKPALKPKSVFRNFASTPLPIRRFDTKAKAIYVNKKWPMAFNRPELPKFEDIKSDELHEMSYWHHSKGQTGKLYKIQSFLVPEHEDNIYQIAVEMPQQDHSLIQIAKLTFANMKDAGFFRGRFYLFTRVPDTSISKSEPSGIMELVLRTGHGYPEPPELTGEYAEYDKIYSKSYLYARSRKASERKDEPYYYYPVSGFWNRRIKEAEEKAVENNNEKLVYRILRNPDSVPDIQGNITEESDYIYWNRVNNVFNKTYNYLEIPVFRKDSAGEYRCTGFFCFDRWKEKKDGTGITEEQVKLVENTLMTMITDVRKKVERDKKVDRYLLHEKLAQVYDEIKKNNDLQSSLSKILNKSIEITGAKGGIVIYRVGNANFLEPIVKDFPGLSQISSLKLDLDVPIVRAWKDGKKLFEPDFQSNKGWFEKFAKSFQTSQENKDKFIKEIKTVASLIILPIYSGKEKRIGAAALYHDKKYHFTEWRIKALELLLKQVRWFLEIREIEYEQENREHAFMHEIRSNLGELNRNFNALKFDYKGPAKKYDQNARLNIQSLLDLSETRSLLYNDIDGNRLAEFKLKGLLEGIYQLYEFRIKFKELELKQETREFTMIGKEDALALVLRIVFDNAVKYASRNGKIVVSTQEADSMCKISVINTGQISEEARKLAFTPGAIPVDQHKDGSHVGLASAEKIINFYGGEISINNDDKNENVEVLLTWPTVKKGVALNV